jgi:hypothetical protein
MIKPDYRPLQYLQTQAHLSRRQARCVLLLQDFHFGWEYLSGASSRAAGALSRQEVDPKIPLWVVSIYTITHQSLRILFIRAQ